MPLDQHRRLPLAGLTSKEFETFCLEFFLSGILLRVKHDGAWIEATVKDADSYGSASGMEQEGIDLRLHMDSGGQWAVQCKMRRNFGLPEARKAVEKAREYQAHHFLLLVAGDTSAEAQKFIDKQTNWTLWNLDRICAEVRRQIAPEQLPKLLAFLPGEQVREFAPWTSHALVSPGEFFTRTLGGEKAFRHDWQLVGRADDLATLHAFVEAEEKRIFVLLSKGGDGKSRLLWEFSRDFAEKHERAEVRFFNPNDDHPIDLALLSSARPLVIIVDDAHREVTADAGHNPRFGQLLDAIRELRHARLILSARPHALTALLNRVSEAGLSHVREAPHSLSRLKCIEVRALAEEALGPEYRRLVDGLVNLTRDSPFMTVMAGEFVRRGLIQWGAWANETDFRREVFRRFEEENLRLLLESERILGERILRLVAMLAPVPSTPDFFASTASVLETGPIHIEHVFRSLEQAELLVGRRDAMRVAPDLFGDFLVFAVCFDQAMNNRSFVRAVLDAFGQQSPTLLQNLAEAAWVAEASGVGDEELLTRLIDAEREAFHAESFYQRAERLVRWQNFGVYLPRQTLALAELALDLKTAPPDATLARWRALAGSQQLDTHNNVLDKISPLVAPIATYHDEHRDAALDLLWRLAAERNETRVRVFDSAEPDETIARVIGFADEKPVNVILDALDWLERKLVVDGNIRRIEERPSLLSALLHPCFERFGELSGREGARFWFGQQEVHLENTRPIRRKALNIIRQVLSTGSWRAALAGISALENAIHRVAPSEVNRAKDGEAIRERWRSERIEGLELLRFAIERHDHFLVRYAVRALLVRDVAFEEDPDFKMAARNLADSIESSPNLRVVPTLLETGAATFLDEDDGGWGGERVRRAGEHRDEAVRRIAAELIETHADTAGLLSYLADVSDQLRAGHYTPTFHRLFTEFSRQAPHRAVELARCILTSPPDDGMATHFVALIDENPVINANDQIEFLRTAACNSHEVLRAAVVNHLTWHADQRALSEDEKSLLFECARDPTPYELKLLLEFVRWAHGPALDWAVEVILALPLERLAHEHAGELLYALTPVGASPDQLPAPEFVAAVLSRLIAAHEIEADRFFEITRKYPRQALDFLLARLRFAETAGEQYRATPLAWRLALDLRSLADEPDYPRLCEELWNRALDADHSQRRDWVRLFQSVVLDERSGWPTRMLAEIKRADSPVRLRQLLDLLQFNGSLIAFRFPEITRAFLQHADEVEGANGAQRIQSALYAISGPVSRRYTSGELDPEDDYLEDEALKSAERHRDDPLLGPFYRWVVEGEQKDRQWNRDDSTASMAQLEES